MTPPEVRIAVTLNAIRWAMNMLVEVTSNHASILPWTVSANLRAAISNLSDADAGIRAAEANR